MCYIINFRFCLLCVLFDGGRNEDGTVTERPRSLEGGGGGHKQVFKKVLVKIRVAAAVCCDE